MEDTGLRFFSDDTTSEEQPKMQCFLNELPVHKQIFNKWIREDTVGNCWELWYSGKCNASDGRAGIGVLLRRPDGGIATTVSKCIDTATATSTEAEYKALIAGLVEALRRNAKRIVAHGENELITEQVNGNFRLGTRDMVPLYATVIELAKRFRDFKVEHVPLEDNGKAHRLARRALRLGN